MHAGIEPDFVDSGLPHDKTLVYYFFLQGVYHYLFVLLGLCMCIGCYRNTSWWLHCIQKCFVQKVMKKNQGCYLKVQNPIKFEKHILFARSSP